MLVFDTRSKRSFFSTVTVESWNNLAPIYTNPFGVLQVLANTTGPYYSYYDDYKSSPNHLSTSYCCYYSAHGVICDSAEVMFGNLQEPASLSLPSLILGSVKNDCIWKTGLVS